MLPITIDFYDDVSTITDGLMITGDYRASDALVGCVAYYFDPGIPTVLRNEIAGTFRAGIIDDVDGLAFVPNIGEDLQYVVANPIARYYDGNVGRLVTHGL